MPDLYGKRSSGTWSSSPTFRSFINVTRDNLWIAGQTAPPPSTSGDPRGFELRGGFYMQGTRIIVDHLRLRGSLPGALNPWYGFSSDDPDSFDYVEIDHHDMDICRHRAGDSSGNPQCQGRVVWRNCSVAGGSDECFTWTHTRVNGQYTYDWKNFAIDNCIIHSSLNHAVERYNETGNTTEDGRPLQYSAGHGYGPLMSPSISSVLFRGNLMVSMSQRIPYFHKGTSISFINNFVFNYGRPGNSRTAVLFFRNNKDDSLFASGLDTNVRLDIAGNYTEAGSRTKHNIENGTRPMFAGSYNISGTGNKIYVYNDANRVLSYYNPDSKSSDRSVTNINTDFRLTTPYYDHNPSGLIPSSGTFEVVGTSNMALPISGVMTADAARDHVLAHAGAWPAARDGLDEFIVNEVENKTADALGHLPAFTEVSARSLPVNSWTTIPANPTQIEANGLTAVENWLHTLHVAAGGSDRYDAAEWVSRKS